MSKATWKTSPSLRKKHFSDAELSMLADTLAAHADVIKDQNLKREVQQRKKEIWQEVACKVSAVGTTPRTVRDCKKRWDDRRRRVRNILASNKREAMATGRGPHSPVKLTTWEETASTFINPESIEEFGEKETGAATSADGGTDGEDGSQDTTTRAPTSPPQKRSTDTTTSGAASQPTPTPSVPDTVDTQLPTTTPVEGEPLEPLATTEDDVEEYVDQEGVTHVGCPHSPSPISTTPPQTQPSPTYSSADPCLHDSDLSPIPEDSTDDAGPVTAPSTTAAPTNSLEVRLVRLESRQEAMLDLLHQYIADG
ncbi:myb-related transcription factor, partner of profilin-like [Ambystoma mexicanum]|uniref:myb-related transcription factor, partner of profilin-like n=1 Tax=Ambystoma mexicanum TaxID=8296 RepID=UPI0037E84746